MIGDNQIVRHKLRYAYAVFYCHSINGTKAYTIPLEGVDGSKAKAIAVCHTDTSAWNPKHIAFQILKVKPGGHLICHFLNSDIIVEPSSKEAQIAKRTIEDCEPPNIRGENKYCATSLESLVDFVITKFGKKVQALANEAEKENKEQKYTMLKGIKMIGDNQIVFHKQRFAYAVFYCHTINATKAYTIPLEGVDGSKGKAIAVCYTDTSAWNPKHIAFQILKVKPGGPPIFHFVKSDTIVWVPN
ncbi:hypothetical protein GH714_040623 [Hevea brasiliensis]|uniref:BURP domain-containing protein n=1 Tax=Hevea brasiliensis TaxID=3981 RepID=A0A6A6L951_HEVBR|nr:hypothetical protein GH714_040623 [Hevea brasiliensis]